MYIISPESSTIVQHTPYKWFASPFYGEKNQEHTYIQYQNSQQNTWSRTLGKVELHQQVRKPSICSKTVWVITLTKPSSHSDTLHKLPWITGTVHVTLVGYVEPCSLDELTGLLNFQKSSLVHRRFHSSNTLFIILVVAIAVL